MGKFTSKIHVWYTKIVTMLVFSGDYMKRSAPCSYDSFETKRGMDKEPDLTEPGFLSAFFVGITLKEHLMDLLCEWILVGHCGMDDFLVNDLSFHLGADVKRVCHDVIDDTGIALNITMDGR